MKANDAFTKPKFTALTFAAMHDQPAVVDFLVDKGADIDQRQESSTFSYHGTLYMPDIYLSTALVTSALFKNLRAMCALLGQGAAVNMTSTVHPDLSPLHMALGCPWGRLAEAVDLLLRAGAYETEILETYGQRQQSLAQLLDIRIYGWHGAPEQKERAHPLLARAPNDRAWRHRGWLVIFRSRRAVAATSERGCCGRDGRCSAARAKHAGGLASSFGAVAEALVGLKPEGVFRNAVGFL